MENFLQLENLKPYLLHVLSTECYDKYFIEKDFADVECGKAVLSKCLGFAIIAGSILVKIPQILKILNSKSAEGINIFSVLLDLAAITFNMSYSFVSKFPFSSWGDNTSLAAQTAIIAILVYYYGGSALKSIIFTVLYGGICYALMGGLTPIEYLWAAQCCNIPILLVGKLSQAYTNFKNKSTGQLSAATCFMLLAGSLARVFTSVQETGDNLVVLLYSVSSLANGIIASQILLYWNKKVPKQKKQATKTQQKGGKTKGKSKKVD
ncbi:mannose-P-dolichol utilization defect 1 protein homolog [Condylostylus longicornis]|uniref:mannose-P-dolichol utilization defect 1 protein homolog n=1 Tax=Condylostylus longicornis TaxID=2530218 RepID=UPI00244DB610|nr:mannose-P-dolichol utilization defect 1 protein homolog [Condylostylus longicornis]